MDELKYQNNYSNNVQKMFQSKKFNILNGYEFENKFKNEAGFSVLKVLKEIFEDMIMGGFKLNLNMLDNRGNKISGWSINEKRGNMSYYPPIGWIGIGLNVLTKYDNGNTDWLGNQNSHGEWCVAYHGVRGNSSDEVKRIIGIILRSTFKPGLSQIHRNCNDKYHPGKEVGIGVYFSPYPEDAESYSGILRIKDKNYKSVLMVRVKPSAIRSCSECNFCNWILNGTIDEIRPYRILLKEC